MSMNEILPLVERARDGDRTAYGELVRRFEPVVYAVALSRLRNAAEAQELAQEVFLHAMTKLDQLRELPCFAGWLRQITVRMAINRLTRRGPVFGAETEVLENSAGESVTPLDELLRAEQRADFQSAGIRLPQHSVDNFLRRHLLSIRLSPIVRIDFLTDDQIAHVLDRGQLRHFFRVFRLVVNSIRWPEQDGFHAECAFNQPLRDIQFPPKLRGRNLV